MGPRGIVVAAAVVKRVSALYSSWDGGFASETGRKGLFLSVLW